MGLESPLPVRSLQPGSLEVFQEIEKPQLVAVMRRVRNDGREDEDIHRAYPFFGERLFM